jgi:hypothetical protein
MTTPRSVLPSGRGAAECRGRRALQASLILRLSSQHYASAKRRPQPPGGRLAPCIRRIDVYRDGAVVSRLKFNSPPWRRGSW